MNHSYVRTHLLMSNEYIFSPTITVVSCGAVVESSYCSIIYEI